MKRKRLKQVKQKLIEQHNFEGVKENAYKLETPFGYSIDLVPFGALEIDDAVQIKGEGLTYVYVTGFKEACEFGVTKIQADENLKNHSSNTRLSGLAPKSFR